MVILAHDAALPPHALAATSIMAILPFIILLWGRIVDDAGGAVRPAVR